MASLERDLNVSEAPNRNEVEHLPPGQYVVMLTAFLESSKEGEELVRVLELDVVEGEYSGRKLFDRLNFGADAQWKIDNCYAAIAEIAKSLGQATAKKDLSNLMNKRLIAEVVVNPSKKDPNKVFNNIKKFLPVNGTVSTPKASSGATVESKADDKSVPPWKRNRQ